VSVGTTRGILAVSIPDGVIGMFYEPNPSGLVADFYSTQPLREMRTSEIS